MIIINTGIPKSGTTILFEYQLDILNKLFKINGLEEFKSRNNDTLFIQNFDYRDFQRIVEVHEKYGSLVVKTHKSPTPFINELIWKHHAKVTCCYRDPRDIMLSALDHGVRSRAGKHKVPSFASCFVPNDILPDLKQWLTIYFDWKYRENVYMIQYEHFIASQLSVLMKMMEIFKMTISIEILTGIIEKHEKLKETKPMFNTGLGNRWKDEMSMEDITLIQNAIGKEIVEMGYPLL